MTLDSIDLSSIAGIILATMFFVEIVKRVLCCYAWFNKIPIFIYACLISIGLVFLSNRVLGTLKGDNIGLLIWRAINAAASASGFYGWLRNPEPPATASQPFIDMRKSNINILIIGILGLLSSCTTLQKRAPNDTPVTNASRQVLAAIEKDLALGIRANIIKDSEKPQIIKVRDEARVVLQAMEVHELANDNLLVPTKTEFDKLLEELIVWRIKVKEKK
jgi:hypothetical protein